MISDVLTEEWRDVPGYEGKYQISNFGRLKSCAKTIKFFGLRTRSLKEVIMKTPLMYRGYQHVHLKTNNTRRRFFIHRLVALAFLPNPENKEIVNHKDGNKSHNTVLNLEWVTQSENIHHWHDELKGNNDPIHDDF